MEMPQVIESKQPEPPNADKKIRNEEGKERKVKKEPPAVKV